MPLPLCWFTSCCFNRHVSSNLKRRRSVSEHSASKIQKLFPESSLLKTRLMDSHAHTLIQPYRMLKVLGVLRLHHGPSLFVCVAELSSNDLLFSVSLWCSSLDCRSVTRFTPRLLQSQYLLSAASWLCVLSVVWLSEGMACFGSVCCCGCDIMSCVQLYIKLFLIRYKRVETDGSYS